VSMELDHQFPAPIVDPGALFRLEMTALLGQLGLKQSSDRRRRTADRR